MPRYRGDWESEYHDPISDAEDRRMKELEEKQNAAIMAEIALCRRMEDDAEFADMVHRIEEEDRQDALQDALDYDLERAMDDYWDDLYEEDYQYWSERSGA